MAAKKTGGYPSVNSILNSKLSNITLMLLGKTGAGKSSLGNAIMNLSGDGGFNVTDELYSTAIYEAVVKEAHVHGRDVKVVDTPGVMDTNADKGGGEEEALQGICDGISKCSEGVDAFFIVLRLDVRLTKEEFDALAKLEQLFGQHFWSHVILVFTHGDCVENDAKQFGQRLTTTKNKMPQLRELLSKLITEPQMVDAKAGREPDVVARQMKSLIMAVDMLVSKNKQKYTNELFAIAKAELATKKSAELEKERNDADQQLARLREKVSGLESQREEDMRMIAFLERRALEAENRVKANQTQATEKVKEKGRKICFIL